MPQTAELDEGTRQQLHSLLYGGMEKLKAAMDEGPQGIASLTGQEAAMIYRTLTEVLGIPPNR